MFLGLLGPDPDPQFVCTDPDPQFFCTDPDPQFVCTDPDPAPSTHKQKIKKNLNFYCFVTSS
jgi:hypothetical protein